jgi:hypothetical protein
LPDVLVLVFFLISPPQVSLPLPGVINDFNFLTPFVTGMYPFNSFMDGSAIGSFLPILKIPVAALRGVPQRRKLQCFVPAVPEKCAPPMCALLLARVLLQISPVRFFLGPASLLLVLSFLVALLLQLALPLIEEDARSDPRFGPGRLPNLDMALDNARGFSMNLLQGYLTFWVYCSILPCPS